MLNQPALYDNATLEDSPSLHLAQVQWHYSYHFTSSSFIHFYSAEFLIGLTLQIKNCHTYDIQQERNTLNFMVIMPLQWNFRITDTLGVGLSSFI